jgi:hypothetical protein
MVSFVLVGRGLAMDYSTLRSRYGYDCDVRGTYAHLPCQPFWTWLTGKDLPKGPPRKPKETLLAEWQMWCQLAWSWSIILIAGFGGALVYNDPDISWWVKVPVMIVSWVLVVNRTRGLLHSFHYTNHGAGIANMERARWMGKYFMSIPILHTPWENYHSIHAKDHHSTVYLCTSKDPDEVFMMEHGFRMGMSEREFWTRLIVAPFFPRNLWNHFKFRLEQNFIKTTWDERLPRMAFWCLFFGVTAYFNVWEEVAIFYLFPLIILTQFSSWIQHTTEHLWFAKKPDDISTFVYYASLTWGRFLGRPHPGKGRGLKHALKLAKWWTLAFVVDLPIRLFSFMQDLPSHDFHHRSPKVNFWSIARERAANEGLPSKYGPMTDTWGMMESFLILRDHLCRGIHDPFGVYEWERAHRRQMAEATAVAAE